jgi:Heme oxygenase
MRLLALLKSETADAHTALEQNLNLFEQVRTKEDYRRLLTRFFTLHEPLEQRLADALDWPAHGFDFASRRKAPLARHDLLTLGATAADIDALPRATALPTIDSNAAAVGCLYVLEGSTLGGQFISKHFASTLGFSPDTGGKFFHGYGPHTATRWREFTQWAEQQNPSAAPDFDTAAVAAARNTFHSFAQWLNR